MVKLSELPKSKQKELLKQVDSKIPFGMTEEELEKEEKHGLNFGARYLGLPIKNKAKGCILNKSYGMKEGGFTKRGGMYKKGY